MEAALVSHSHDRYCGGALNPENNAEEGASVFSKIQVDTLNIAIFLERLQLCT